MIKDCTYYEQNASQDGRVYIPSRFKKAMGMCPKDLAEITFEYGKVIVKKFERKDILLRPNIGIVRNLSSDCHVSIPREYLSILSIKGKLPKKFILRIVDRNKLEISAKFNDE